MGGRRRGIYKSMLLVGLFPFLFTPPLLPSSQPVLSNKMRYFLAFTSLLGQMSYVMAKDPCEIPLVNMSSRRQSMSGRRGSLTVPRRSLSSLGVAVAELVVEPTSTSTFERLPASSPKQAAVVALCHESHWSVTVAAICLFAVLGVLVRVGLSALFGYPTAPVFGLIWAQIFGCALMGFVRALPDADAPDQRRFLPAPLKTGLTTGLCGTITTFSSFAVGGNLIPTYLSRFKCLRSDVFLYIS
ncbi:hypothetical protein BC830DRAFT_930383 [Chytriomyces sp. MP71]|nr:hypothetical protein BC830DRAFT_930383 [Chytriomyces sp. MP71]